MLAQGRKQRPASRVGPWAAGPGRLHWNVTATELLVSTKG